MEDEFLELCLRGRLLADIRIILPGKFPVGAFDFLGQGIASHAHDLV